MTVHVIVSCTDRKRAAVPDELSLRQLEHGPTRAEDWLRRLAEHDCQTVSARNLYGGEHWQVALQLESELRDAGRDVQLWVASAGYGLVSLEAQLKPYSATFAPREPDSVPPEGARDWWGALCAGGPQAKSLQSIANGPDNLVVVASAKYLRAMLPDLHRARDALDDPQRLIVFSGSKLPELGESLVDLDGRVQVALRDETDRNLRGSKQALSIRAARHLLMNASEWPLTAQAMRSAYLRLVNDVERPEVPKRERHEDDDVLAFIAKQLDEKPRAGWTSLLRAWRGSGQACEQKRFRGLYQRVRAERE